MPDLHLIVGYDGSPPATRALDTAVRLLLGRPGHITVVYVAHIPSAAAMSAEDVGDLEESFDEAEKELRVSAGQELHDFTLGWDFVRRNGLVRDELIAAATEAAAAGPDDTAPLTSYELAVLAAIENGELHDGLHENRSSE